VEKRWGCGCLCGVHMVLKCAEVSPAAGCCGGMGGGRMRGECLGLCLRISSLYVLNCPCTHNC
jgi:hypothetical protein